MNSPQRLQQAYTAGTWARQAGRALSRCPAYGIDRENAPELRAQWQAGWLAQDKGRKAA